MNPAINDVVAAFGKISVHPTSMVIDGTGVDFPSGGHFQGIQRLPTAPELLVITSDSDTQAYFVACKMAEDGLSARAYSPVTMAMSPLKHAGGCQAFGNYLVAGVEDNDSNQASEVQFWDFTRFPTQLVPMTIPRSGGQYVSTAGAVGLSSHGTRNPLGTALAVATFSAATIDFYVSGADPFGGSPFTPVFTWVESKADKTGWIDQNFGAYQSVNLITQTDGQLFMVGTHRAGDYDFMDLYGVNLNLPPEKAASALTKLAKKHMICTNGCNFNAGAGIFIPSSAGFEVYAVPYNPVVVPEPEQIIPEPNWPTTIQVNHFTAP
jgi:hypothetical protein